MASRVCLRFDPHQRIVDNSSLDSNVPKFKTTNGLADNPTSNIPSRVYLESECFVYNSYTPNTFWRDVCLILVNIKIIFYFYKMRNYTVFRLGFKKDRVQLADGGHFYL